MMMMTVMMMTIMTDKMHYDVSDVFYSQYSYQHVSAATAVIFSLVFCNVWLWVLVFTVFCIDCTVFFVLFLLCMFILICFVCTSVSTTATE
jgi:hypothetical protein